MPRIVRLVVVPSLLPAVLIAVLASRPASAQASGDAASGAERDAVLAVVQAFFDTMAAKDVPGARGVLTAQGRFHAVEQQEGAPRIRTFSHEEYLSGLPTGTSEVRERMWDPVVRVHGAIATVWTPYDFWRDGALSHCGIDAIDLIRTAEGWRIAGGTYTVERDCAPSPLGPLTP